MMGRYWMVSMRGNRQRQGSVLLVVLWLLVMLALIAQGVAQRTRSHLVLARAQIDLAQERLTAQAGVLHGALLLLDPAQPLPPRLNLTGADAPVVFGSPVDIEIVDECGRVDLNTGRSDMITALFSGLGQSETARRQAKAVLDWRDPGNRPRPQGAERDAYRAAGRQVGPRNGPFETIDELYQVLGLDAETVARLAPSFTVDCLNAGVDPLSADARLLRLLPSQAAPDALQSFLHKRDKMIRDGGREMLWPPGLETYVTASDGHAYGIKATTRGEKPAASWFAVVWPGGGARQSLTFRTWRPDRWFIHAAGDDNENDDGMAQRRLHSGGNSR